MEQSTSTNQMLNVSSQSVQDAVQTLIDHAVEMGASDVFLLSNEDYMSISVRHLGLVRPVSIVSHDQGKRFIQHIKAQSGMDVAEHRKPLDGRWIYESEVQPGAVNAQHGAQPNAPASAPASQRGSGYIQQPQPTTTVDLRLSIIPTLYGEDVSIRLLSREMGLFSLDELGMTSQQLRAFRAMLESPGGLILCTGPTGSGKTATLYAALRHLHNGSRKINTIEDPVEFAIDGLRQSQIRPMLGLNFAELLTGVLRQSPDIIMIGEIRDTETAKTAVRAANSGHLVFSTIHAPVAAAAVQSLRSLGVNDHFLATALRGVISQRLVRTLDPASRVEFDISHAPQIFEPIKNLLGPGEGDKFYAPGPADGRNSGYLSRTGVFETLDVTAEVRQLVSQGSTTHAIRQKAIEQGMLEFRHNALLKVARGQTSVEEVFRVIPAEYLDEEEGA